MKNKQCVQTIANWTGTVIAILLFIIIGTYSFSRVLSTLNTTTVYEVPTQDVTHATTKYGQLTIGTYNIAHGRGHVEADTNWKYDSKAELITHLEAIADQIKQVDADIVILNEVDFSAAWSFHVNQAKFVATQAGYPYVAEQRNIDVSLPLFSFQFGNAILSKYPLSDLQLIKLTPYSRWEDILAGSHDSLFSLVETPFGQIGVVAVHLEHRSEDVRVQSVRKIIEWSQSMTLPLIAAGDFNSTPIGFSRTETTDEGHNAMTLLVKEGDFTSAPQITSDTRDFTFTYEQPRIMIDWVLARGGIEVINSKIIHSDLSDHFMVIAKVAMKSKEPLLIDIK